MWFYCQSFAQPTSLWTWQHVSNLKVQRCKEKTYLHRLGNPVNGCQSSSFFHLVQTHKVTPPQWRYEDICRLQGLSVMIQLRKNCLVFGHNRRCVDVFHAKFLSGCCQVGWTAWLHGTKVQACALESLVSTVGLCQKKTPKWQVCIPWTRNGRSCTANHRDWLSAW